MEEDSPWIAIGVIIGLPLFIYFLVILIHCWELFKFGIKYPKRSYTMPNEDLRRGDTIFFSGEFYIFNGIDTNYRYVLVSEHGTIRISWDELEKNAVQLRSPLGLKWSRVKEINGLIRNIQLDFQDRFGARIRQEEGSKAKNRLKYLFSASPSAI